MYILIHQNNDLCEVSGFAFPSLARALADASKRIGKRCVAADAYMAKVGNAPNVFYVAQPIDGSTELCREGHMTIIADAYEAMDIAIRLTRRNGHIYGDGQVIMGSPPVDESAD